MFMMNVNNILKHYKYCELTEGKRPVHKAKLSYKDCIVQTVSIMQNDWEQLVLCGSPWGEIRQ